MNKPDQLHMRNGFSFEELQTPAGLQRLDQSFLDFLARQHTAVYQTILRHRSQTFSKQEVSEFILACAPLLEAFIVDLYNLHQPVAALKAMCLAHDSIFLFKKHYVLQEACRKIRQKIVITSNFKQQQHWLETALQENGSLEHDRELAVANLGQFYLSKPKQYAGQIDKLIDWCVMVMCDEVGKKQVIGWSSFKLPERRDNMELVSTVRVKDDLFQRLSIPNDQRHHREGFALTDKRFNLRQIYDQLHYCVYCHARDSDFCSSGFPVKKGKPELGLRQHPLGDIMMGCPLDEKISEMQYLKKQGDAIAALATIIIDNPLCPLTGHRICNDCMKSCIYQKQAPVDTPQIETRVLTDVLHLPWGVEIYDLLVRWNPLRQRQWCAKANNGHRVLIMGMGPAGITLAHHLLMEGCTVVGMDGLKIEHLPTDLLQGPVHRYADWLEPLDNRQILGFGGVAEYGITSRWDKNFLKLVYLTLTRRQHFQLIDNVRFGGNLTVERAQQLGFEHLAIAVGAGLPRELMIPNSLAPGMYHASDFLMRLQLTGLNQKKEPPTFTVQLPAVIIGGGLTAVDTATEVQAYYLTQIEKRLCYYENWERQGYVDEKLAQLSPLEQACLQEQITHAKQLRQLRQSYQNSSEPLPVNDLIRQWGGVTLAYRRSILESPAYRQNHDELASALQEGIYYAEHLQPLAVQLDQQGHVSGLRCYRQQDNQPGEIVLPARTIFVATGAKPNIAYEYEHRGTFERDLNSYSMYTLQNSSMLPIPTRTDQHCKQPSIGMFTSYCRGTFRISFLGDIHPVFHGSLAKAMASGKAAYPKIMQALQQTAQPKLTHLHNRSWLNHLKEQFSASVISNQVCHPDWQRVVLKAPIAADAYQPGQFYRLQRYMVHTPGKCHSVPRIVLPVAVDASLGQLEFLIRLQPSDGQSLQDLQIGEKIALMGPTGAYIKLPKKSNGKVLIIGDQQGMIATPVLAKAMAAQGYQVFYISCLPSKDTLIDQKQIENSFDAVYWIVQQGQTITKQRIQDRSVVCKDLSGMAGLFIALQKSHRWPALGGIKDCDRIQVFGDVSLLALVRKIYQENWKPKTHHANVIGGVHGPMQCMLKGICAQCLQWQIDETGQRTKAVFACSWQDQPLTLIDLEHLAIRRQPERLAQLFSKRNT